MGILANKELKNRIEHLLEAYPESRDSDYKIIANLWYEDLNLNYQLSEEERKGVRKMMKVIAEGLVSHPESIRRHRQKIQESNPKLRGRKYNERVGKLERETRAESRRR